MKPVSNSDKQIDIPKLNQEFNTATAAEIIEFAIKTFDKKLTLACSFSKEDVSIMEILHQKKYNASVFILDTGRLPEETYEIWQSCKNRYKNIEFNVFLPEAHATAKFVETQGPYPFYESIELRKQCCQLRKIEPLKLALEDKLAWMTGMRREQSITRSDLKPFELDTNNQNIIKINPLCSWTESELNQFVKTHNVPVHPLHKKGYPSIGCAPCTRAVTEGEDFRAGRWWWESAETKECGLHAKS